MVHRTALFTHFGNGWWLSQRLDNGPDRPETGINSRMYWPGFNLVVLGFGQGFLLPVAAALTGFFTSFTYTWIVVYIPEVFPTERRGACMGWTTTIARVSYVIGPLLTGFVFNLFPTMEWFWVVGGVVILIPIAIVLLFNPSETKTLELEQIETGR